VVNDAIRMSSPTDFLIRTAAPATPGTTAALSRYATAVWLLQLVVPTVGFALSLRRLNDPYPFDRLALLLMAFCLLWYGACFLFLAVPAARRWIATHPAQLTGLYVSGAFGLAIAEGVCRVFVATGQPANFGPRCVQFSPALGWILIPGVDGVGDHGWRGHAIPRAKADGRFRIVCVGDSTTFGFHCSWEDAWPSQLETVLNNDGEWTRTFGRTEVLNLGVPGYGPDQSMLALKEFGLAFSPDVVIFQLCLNDFADASYDHHWLRLGGSTQYKPCYVLEDGHLVRQRELVPLPRDPTGKEFNPADPKNSEPSARLSESALWRLVRKQVQNVVARSWRKSLMEFPPQHWPIHDAFRANYGNARPLVWAMIKEMSRMADEAGAVFLVALSPANMSLVNAPEDAPPWRLESFLHEYDEDARAAGITALNCVPEFFAARGNNRFLLPHDHYHLNPQGNAFIAQLTARWLKREYAAERLRRTAPKVSRSN